MPCLAAKFDPRVGPIIPVDLRPVRAEVSGKAIRIFALIDTGASRTCIAASVARALGLTPIGKAAMVSASHTSLVNQYLVDLLVPFGDQSHRREGLVVIEYADHGAPEFQMHLGRDVLAGGLFTMSMDGHFTLAL